MQAELERHGGVFEGNMLYDHTDYLIVRNIYSEKYRIALEWGTIILVNEYWFQDSVRCNSTLLRFSHNQNFKTRSTTRTSRKPSRRRRTKRPISPIRTFDRSWISKPPRPSPTPVYRSSSRSKAVESSAWLLTCRVFNAKQDDRAHTRWN